MNFGHIFRKNNMFEVLNCPNPFLSHVSGHALERIMKFINQAGLGHLLQNKEAR
jgi:hypothetical protein